MHLTCQIVVGEVPCMYIQGALPRPRITGKSLWRNTYVYQFDITQSNHFCLNITRKRNDDNIISAIAFITHNNNLIIEFCHIRELNSKAFNKTKFLCYLCRFSNNSTFNELFSHLSFKLYHNQETFQNAVLVILGDLNVYNSNWLKYSPHNDTAG